MNIKCVNCLRKHLAAGKSFMREVLDGHSENAFPDHRMDIEGEIANAEYHAALIDDEFMRKLRTFRRTLQEKRFIPSEEDLMIISVFYYVTDKFDGLEVCEEILEQYSSIKKADIVSNVGAKTSQNGCGCKGKSTTAQ